MRHLDCIGGIHTSPFPCILAYRLLIRSENPDCSEQELHHRKMTFLEKKQRRHLSALTYRFLIYIVQAVALAVRCPGVLELQMP